MPKVNIIDADTLAVAAAEGAQKKSIIAKDKVSGKTLLFKNITELKESLKEQGVLDRLQDFEVENVVEADDVSHALYNVKSKLKNISDFVDADKNIVLIGGKATYRQSLELPSPYKNNRGVKPLHLQACKDYLVEYKGAQVVEGVEADDETCILAEEYKKKGWDVVLSSPDHDSFQMQGIWLLNYKEKNLQDGLRFLADHSFDTIKKEKYTKSVGSGVGYLAGQLLIGDGTDTYKPTEIAGLKYGMQSAKKAFKDCIEPKDFLEVVKLKYQEWYPKSVTYTTWDGKQRTKDWQGLLQMYFQCAYMLRSRGDKAVAKDFFLKYGVEL